MARPRQPGPTSVPVANGDNADTRPSLDLIFRDLALFVDDISQYIVATRRVLQELRFQYHRDLLHRAEQLGDQVEDVKADITDLRRSNFIGLRSIFRHPEVIALDQLQILLARINSIWFQTWRISHDDLHDQTSGAQRESFEEFTTSISVQITRTRDDLDSVPNPSFGSLLCKAAAGILEGNQTSTIGTVRKHDAYNKHEKAVSRRTNGHYRAWHCSRCHKAFTFYVKSRNPTLEDAMFPARVHQTGLQVKYRDMWCAKSHLANSAGAKYACLLCLGQGRELKVGSNAFNDDTDLALHLGMKHNSHSLPTVFMQRLHITKKSEDEAGIQSSRDSNEMGRERSDLRFLQE